MPAYYASAADRFLEASEDEILGALARASSYDDTPQQKRAWLDEIYALKAAISAAVKAFPPAIQWGLLLEYPLLRLGHRLDAVILAGSAVCVLEFKVGSDGADSASRRQVEDYAADLRDFHAPTQSLVVFPGVCATEATPGELFPPVIANGIAKTQVVAVSQIDRFLLDACGVLDTSVQISVSEWNAGAYRPVPTIIKAASMIYVSNSVADIRNALTSHANLTTTVERLAKIRRFAMEQKKHIVCFVTGVPGSGKTLVGLDLVHDERFGSAGAGEAAFLSGNSPLVAVLREALAKDSAEARGTSINQERNDVRARIQHLMSYLGEYLDHNPDSPPHEHIIVFDEAQRAWDEKYGKQKFGRTASEPLLFLDIMSRHSDWALIVALVGGGQEINRGEHGLIEWGKALNHFNSNPSNTRSWSVYASEDTIAGRAMYGGTPLWDAETAKSIESTATNDLHLEVSIRSYRNEVATEWVAAVLDGRQLDARRLATEAGVAQFPIYITRSLEHARSWLRTNSIGYRRFGLLATSGARRLRGYGLGVTLKVTELKDIVHWFLAEHDDLRSSQALEVTGTEFACQGLEIDRACVCWDHDMIWNPRTSTWLFRTFQGTKWRNAKDAAKRRYIANSYRVLLSRAREAMVIWIPPGEPGDETRQPAEMNATYRYLISCGVRTLEEVERMSNVG